MGLGCVKWNLVLAFIIPILLLFLTHSLASLVFGKIKTNVKILWCDSDSSRVASISIKTSYFNFLFSPVHCCRFVCWVFSSAYHSPCNVVHVIPSFLRFLKETHVLVEKKNYLQKIPSIKTKNSPFKTNAVLSDSVDVIQICFVFIGSPVAR